MSSNRASKHVFGAIVLLFAVAQFIWFPFFAQFNPALISLTMFLVGYCWWLYIGAVVNAYMLQFFVFSLVVGFFFTLPLSWSDGSDVTYSVAEAIAPGIALFLGGSIPWVWRKFGKVGD